MTIRMLSTPARSFREGLVHTRERLPFATLTQLDATTMTETKRYDVIGAFDVIEHIDKNQLVLENLSRALNDGGALIISVPQHQWLWSEVNEYACHVPRYTRRELLGKVQATGLKVQYISSFVSIFIPLMWLSRLRARKGEYNPMAEFQLPVWLNLSLEWIMRLELRLLKLGVSIPVGGSLLLVAKKQ